MSVNEIVGSKGFGEWSRWLLAYIFSLTIGVVGGAWLLSGYSHDLTNELAGIHQDAKQSNRKLDIVLGVPGESAGLLPPLAAKVEAIIDEQTHVRARLAEENSQRVEMGRKLDNLIQTTGSNNPILNRIEKRLTPPHPTE